MKKIIRILALALVLVMLTGCGRGTKLFTCGDLTMLIPSGMKDVSGQSEFAGHTFALKSKELVIFGLEERHLGDPLLEEYTLLSYTQEVIRGNGLSCVPLVRNNEDYTYFSYTCRFDDQDYRYLVAVYRTDESFWMIQLSCLVEQYEEAACFRYLDSVEFQ